MGFLTRALAAIGVYPSQGMSPPVEAMFHGIKPGAIVDPPIRGTREHLANYRQSPWLHSIVGRIADTVATTEWRLFVAQGPTGKAIHAPEIVRAQGPRRKALMQERQKRGELREITSHLLLDTLRSGNSVQTGHQVLMTAQQHLELVGEAFWLKERSGVGAPERNGVGAPIGLWPIPPHWVLSMPTPSKKMYRIGWRGWQEWLPDTEVLWINQSDPYDPYGRGVGTAQSLGDELATDENAAKTVLQWFYNRAKPDVLITAEGMKESEATRLEEDWHNRSQGFWRAWKTHFLNRKVDVHEFDADFRCFSADTECLTRRGWVLHDALRPDDAVATWNQDGERLEWQQPTAVHRYEHRGPMHHWKNAIVDALVTPNHRLFFRPITKGSARWALAESQDVAAGRGYERGCRPRSFTGRWGMWWRTAGVDASAARVRVEIPEPTYAGPGRHSPALWSYSIPVEIFAPFLGYFLSEGSLSDRGYFVSMSQTTASDDLSGVAKDIWNAALALGPARRFRHTRKKSTGRSEWAIGLSNKGLALWLREQAGGSAKTKRIPAEVFEWPEGARRQLLFAMIDGDGRWCRKNAECEWSADYGTASRQLADDVQRLCVGLGVRSLLACRPRHDGYDDQYIVNMTARDTAQVFERQLSTVEYAGIVWCVSVPNETIFTRRNGKVMLSGNSQQFVQIRQQQADTMMRAWGFPPEILGHLENSNRSTIGAADYLYTSKVIEPRLHFLCSILQERLVPEYDDRLILDYVSPVEEDRAAALEASKVFPWALSVDEQRAMIGAPELPNGGGRVYMIPFQVTPATEFTATPPPIAPSALPIQTPAGGKGVDLSRLDFDELLALRELTAKAEGA